MPSSPDSLTAVLQLLLDRGLSYAEIARLVSTDEATVRSRAVAAARALAPATAIPEERQGLIADYLLGQLPISAESAIRRIMAEPAEGTWARALRSGLASVTSAPLPEIPDEVAVRRASASVALQGPPPPVAAPASSDERPTPVESANAPSRERWLSGVREHPRMLLGASVIMVAVAAAVAALATGGGSDSRRRDTRGARSARTPAATATTTSTRSTPVRLLAKVTLTPPTGDSKAVGVADVVQEGTRKGLVIIAQGVSPNTKHPTNAYAVWLYNSPTDAQLLGFVNPGVGKSGRLETAGGVSSGAARYARLLITLETRSYPKTPGRVVLEGTLRGL
jgi:hypothetical protein